METKFRAWDIHNKRWMSPEIEDGEESELRLTIWGDIIFRLPWYEQEYPTISKVCGNNSFELYQYTGLKDINGVEIYVGDILADNKYSNLYGAVEWGSGEFICIDGSDENLKANLERFNLEVIGNIKEDKNILKYI